MSGSYKLINPHIDGSLNVDYKAKNSIDAAHKIWQAISENLSNNVPKFAFSLEKTNDGSLHHFIVSEMIGGNKDVNYSIDELSLDMTNIQETVFKQFVKESAKKREAIQNGGRRRRFYHDIDFDDLDDSSSSSSSSSLSEEKELYHKLKYMKQEADAYKPTKKITYWWYNPTIYKLNNLYIPTFISSSPYVQLNTNSAYWGV